MGLAIFLIGSILTSITVEGNRFFSDRALVQAAGLERGTPFRRPSILRASWTMEELYKEKGFLDVQITFEVQKTPKGMAVIFHITEGPRYRIGDIVVLNWGPLLTKDQFIRMIPHIRNVDDELLGKAQRKIVRYYQNRGYPFASLTRSIEKRKDTTVVLQYQVKSGPLVWIDQIHASTNGDLSVRRIVKATGITPPTLFRQNEIENAIRNLYRMQVVQGVSYEPETLSIQGETLHLALRFSILERSARFIRFGTGFQTPNRMEGSFAVGHRNLLGNGQEIVLSTYGALRFDLLDRFSTEQILLSYREPYFLGFNASSFLQVSYLLDVDRLTREWGVRWTVEKSWRDRIVSRTSLSWRKNFSGLRGITNTVEEVVMVEGRDNPLDTRRGFWVSMGHTHAGGWLQGHHHFERSVMEGRLYLPISGDLTLALRGRSGWFWFLPRPSTIQPVDLLTLGGDGSLRGYPLNTVGPYRPEGSPFAYGTLLGNLNVELRLRGRGLQVGGMRIPLGATLFWDAGVLDTDWPPQQKAHHSVGIGMRLHSLAIPLRLDIGIALPSGKKQVLFALGQMF